MASEAILERLMKIGDRSLTRLHRMQQRWMESFTTSTVSDHDSCLVRKQSSSSLPSVLSCISFQVMLNGNDLLSCSMSLLYKKGVLQPKNLTMFSTQSLPSCQERYGDTSALFPVDLVVLRIVPGAGKSLPSNKKMAECARLAMLPTENILDFLPAITIHSIQSRKTESVTGCFAQ